jgi:hypothetical protein
MAAVQRATHVVGEQQVVISGRDEMIRGMNPQVVPGVFVFATIAPDERVSDGLTVYSTVRETEGLSVVIAREDAGRLDLVDPVELGWITLTVNSSLEGVGLTAAVSAVLAEHEIACNVIAGHHHDHLLVPVERVDEAMRLLIELASQR